MHPCALEQVTARSPCRPTPPRCPRVEPARSAESSSRIGLVLLTWIRILRGPAAAARATRACRPGPTAAGGRCRARACCEIPSRIISSSVQNVPSTQHAVGARREWAADAARCRPGPARRRASCRCAGRRSACRCCRPGCGSSRCGEYGGGLLLSGTAVKRKPSTPAMLKGCRVGRDACQSTPQ